MDRSFIIRIYSLGNESISGILLDVEQNRRDRFNSANQLWSLIAGYSKDQSESNVIQYDDIKDTHVK